MSIDSGPATAAASVNRVETFRPLPGSTHFVRILSESYGGLFTHYYQKRSRICDGNECPAPMHRFDRVWKGYCAAMAFVESTKKWRPICLEITEHMELDMRTLFARGTEWELVRHAGHKGEITPIFALFRKRWEAEKMPPAFDYVPCVKSLYHRAELDLSHKNPQAPRVIMEDFDADPPEALAGRLEKEAEEKASYEYLQKKMQETMKAKRDANRPPR